MSWFKIFRDGEPTEITHVTIDQSNSTIGIPSVKNLNVNHIGGTINNGVKSIPQPQSEPQPQPKPQPKPGQSIAIGFVGSLDDFWEEDKGEADEDWEF